METFKYKPNLKKRIFAALIDYAFFFILTFFYIAFFGKEDIDGTKTVTGVLTLPLIMVWFIYFVVVEAIFKGTLGHHAFDLKVLTLDRKEIEFINALKRHLIDPIDILFYGIPAIIAIKNTEKNQRLGDLWAKTIVVDTSDADQIPSDINVPQ